MCHNKPFVFMCGSSVPKSTANVALATVLFCGAAEIFPGSLFRWCSGTTLSRMWRTLTPRVPGIVCSAWRLVLSRLSASRNMNSSSPCSDGEVGRTHHIHTSETHTHKRECALQLSVQEHLTSLVGLIHLSHCGQMLYPHSSAAQCA